MIFGVFGQELRAVGCRAANQRAAVGRKRARESLVRRQSACGWPARRRPFTTCPSLPHPALVWLFPCVAAGARVCLCICQPAALIRPSPKSCEPRPPHRQVHSARLRCRAQSNISTVIRLPAHEVAELSRSRVSAAAALALELTRRVCSGLHLPCLTSDTGQQRSLIKG